MRRYLLSALVSATLGVALVGCGDDEASSDYGQIPDGDIEPPFGGDNMEDSCRHYPDVDSDGDGLLDIVEDANRNCMVDPGETDPMLPDTDGDGLLDGDEDVDGNGVWDEDRGELNPLLFDTNGDGIPDGQEARSRVCTRAHYTALRDERLLLNSEITLYAHRDIAFSAPAGQHSVFLKGHTPGAWSLMLSMEDAELEFEALVTTFAELLSASLSVELMGYRWIGSAHQNAAHVRVNDSGAAFELLVGALSALDPSIRSFSIPDDLRQATQGRAAVIQLMLLDDKGKRRLAITSSLEDVEDNWLNVAHPRLIAPNPTDVIRLFCEDVESSTRQQLDVFIAVEEGVSGATLALWDSIIPVLQTVRADQNMQTRAWIATMGETGPEWIALSEDALGVGVLSNAPVVDAPSFLGLGSALMQQIPGWTSNENDQLVLIFAGPGEEGEELTVVNAPENGTGLTGLSTVVVSPSPAPFSCPVNARAERFEDLVNFAKQSDSYLISSCGFSGQMESARKVLAPFVGPKWLGGGMRPIWNTLSLATEDGYVPAEITMAGERLVIFASGAQPMERSAVSYGFWDASSVPVSGERTEK